MNSAPPGRRPCTGWWTCGSPPSAPWPPQKAGGLPPPAAPSSSRCRRGCGASQSRRCHRHTSSSAAPPEQATHSQMFFEFEFKLAEGGMSETNDGPPVHSDSSRAPQKEECRHTKNLFFIKCRFIHALICAGAMCVQAFQVLLVRGTSFLHPNEERISATGIGALYATYWNEQRRCMQEASNSFLCTLNLRLPACHMLAVLHTSRETLFNVGCRAGLHRAHSSSWKALSNQYQLLRRLHRASHSSSYELFFQPRKLQSLVRSAGAQ